MLFKTYLDSNSEVLKNYMNWENYDLNETMLPVIEAVQNDALEVLSNTYGKFDVDDILDELKADVFINFPPLLKQLSISNLMIGKAVVPKDILTETTTRTEKGLRDISGTTDKTLDTETTELNTIDTSSTTTSLIKDTGTTKLDTSSNNIQENDTEITNTTGVEMTGSRSVNINNSMPEQSINGSTGNFPVDVQGTPILDTSFAQSASQNFNSTNPINSSETSMQTGTVSNNTINESVTTNDLTNSQDSTVADEGTTNRTTSNTGTDTTLNNTLENTDIEISETTTREATNAQYAYEIKAFLDSVDAINAFQRWADKFSWVCGIQ